MSALDKLSAKAVNKTTSVKETKAPANKVVKKDVESKKETAPTTKPVDIETKPVIVNEPEPKKEPKTPATAVKPMKDKPKKEEKVSFSQKAIEEGGKMTSVRINDKLLSFLKRRKTMLHVSIQEYINVLIAEEAERFEPDQADELYNNITNLERDKKTPISAIITLSNTEFFSMVEDEYGINRNQYINYIVYQEIKRENEKGKRTSL